MTDYLSSTIEFIRANDFDNAWRTAYQAILKLPLEDSYVFYYQLSIIRKKEKRYEHALIEMAICVNLHLRFSASGISRGWEKHIRSLLKRLEQEDKYSNFLSQCSGGTPKEMPTKVSNWLSLQKY